MRRRPLDLPHGPDLRDVDAAPGSAPVAPAWPAPVFPGDPALALSRVARAVRMSVGLWKQHTEDMDAQAAESADAARERRNARAAERRARAARLVERIADEHFEAALPGEENDDEAVEAVRRVSAEARERLDDEDLYGDVADLPFSQIVARLCAELGLSPDWARLAQEHWAQAELAAGAAGGPLAGEAPPEAASAPVAASPPFASSKWRRRQRLKAAGPDDGPRTSLTVRFVDTDGRRIPNFGRRPKARDDFRPETEPDVQPTAPLRAPPPPELAQEEAAAADLAARMAFAELGPRHRPSGA